MTSTDKYLAELKQWLADTADEPLEDMAAFFTKRLSDYEKHMAIWEKSYQNLAESLPVWCKNILDLGCGTGLELDKIWNLNPDIAVTGVDLCQGMLDKLSEKHSQRKLTTVCQDYFRYDFGKNIWDAVISFESLHHFLPEPKKELYQRIYQSIKEGGVFLLGDYTACCEEEEALLRGAYLEKRKRFGIAEGSFVHFDIPLTIKHESDLLKNAGFTIEKIWDAPDEATLLIARKTKRKGK